MVLVTYTNAQADTKHNYDKAHSRGLQNEWKFIKGNILIASGFYRPLFNENIKLSV